MPIETIPLSLLPDSTTPIPTCPTATITTTSPVHFKCLKERIFCRPVADCVIAANMTTTVPCNCPDMMPTTTVLKGECGCAVDNGCRTLGMTVTVTAGC